MSEQVTRVIEIIENEPLGYKTEAEHAALEAFAVRLIAKIRSEFRSSGSFDDTVHSAKRS